MRQEILDFLKLCQGFIPLRLADDRAPVQFEWVKNGRLDAAAARIVKTDEDRFLISLPTPVCAIPAHSNYCQGVSLDKNTLSVQWNQEKVYGGSWEFSDENVCAAGGLKTYLSAEFADRFPSIVENLISKLDADIFAKLSGLIKPTPSGVQSVKLVSINQDGSQYAQQNWAVMLKTWERKTFQADKQFKYIANQDALTFMALSGVSAMAQNAIAYSSAVEEDYLYQIARGSYFILQKQSLKNGFYKNSGPQDWMTIFSTLNANRTSQDAEGVYQMIDPFTGIIIDLVVMLVKDCNSEYKKWVITPQVTYQLFVPTYETCANAQAPHMYKIPLCGIPEPVCAPRTQPFIAPRLCLAASSPIGCVSAAAGSLVTISDASPAVVASGVVGGVYGLDVSTMFGKVNAINAALSGVVNGGLVSVIGGEIEYQGSFLVNGATYTVTLACGGTFTFTVGACTGVAQPVNNVLPSLVVKSTSPRFTENATGGDDSIDAIIVNNFPVLTIGLPMSSVSAIQATINAYLASNGITGSLTYYYSQAASGGESYFSLTSVSNADFATVEFTVNGVAGSIGAFA